MELKTSMELIKILVEKHMEKQNAKKVVKSCGPEKYEDYEKPLAAMSHEDAMQMYLNGLAVTAAMDSNMIYVCE